MTPIAEGVAVNGITALAGKVLSKIHRRYSLTGRMRRDLRRDGAKEKQNRIHDALERSIGNFSGLTQASNQALLDISSSGLLDHLVSIFGSDLPDTDAKLLMSYIHLSRGARDSEASEVFANQMAICLRSACEQAAESYAENLTFEGQRRQKRILADRAKRSATIISSLVTSLVDKEGRWIEGKDFNPLTVAGQISAHFDPLQNYAKSTLQSLNTVDVHGSSGDVVRVELDQIYVDVPVSYIPRNGNFVGYQDLRRHLPRTEIANSWDDTLEFISKTVLLGDPGGGKSTLSKKLCSETAKQFLSGGTTLPVFVQLRTYIARAADDERLTLAHYILEQISSTVLDPDTPPVEATVLYHLRIGSAFVVADGLDEVLTPTNRARVVGELERFTKEFPLVSLLVTSRYVGYETQPLDGFSHLGVDHLDDGAIVKIYNNVSCTVLKKDDVETEKNRSVFLADAHRKAAELIRSPLLLTLIVIIYSKKSEIPDNRAGLYGFCADLLFERWDGYRDIIPDLPERYRLFDLFKHLSALLYEREEYGGRINKDDLLDEARDFFRKDYIDNREGKSAEAARHMVDHLTGRAWILHEVGENVFEFTHRTFMEFFYARHLESVHEGTSDLISECLQHVSVGSRTVPAHLALQIRTKDKRGASTTVCKALGDAITGEPHNAELIDFSLDALGYLLPDATTMSDFVSALAPVTLALDSPMGPIKLLCNDNPMRVAILEGSLAALQGVSKVHNIRVLSSALHRLHRDGKGTINRMSGNSIDICSMIVTQSYSKQSSSPFLCKLAFDLDAAINWKAVEKFGLRIWNNGKSMGLMQLVSDSRHMLLSASKSLTDADFSNDKYLKLATLLSQSVEEANEKIFLENYYLGHLRHDDMLADTVDVTLDPESWREDRVALETLAFCLTLFLETNSELIQKNELEKFKRAYINLVDALEVVKSAKANWYSRWITGDATLLVSRRYVNRRMRHFLEA